jgi:cyclopropane fatty-acyl-phospholipid synthase-like methyltransferase
MNNLEENQKNLSNSSVDWATQYDFYEVNYRNVYRINAKPQNESHFEMLQQKANKYLIKKNVFCEIGFGSGITLRLALKYFGKVYGLDISPKNVELTQKELTDEGFSNFQLDTSDIKKFNPLYENKFDVISYIHGLEHFSNEDYPDFFLTIKKYLKPGGIFTGALPNNLPFSFRMCPNCNHIFEIDGHIAIHSKETLKEIFERNGFEIIYLNSINFKYLLKTAKKMKLLYYFINNGLFKKEGKFQLEFIVRPIESK